MKINVQVKTKAKKEGVEQHSEDSFTVRVNTPPVDGKANKRVIELLSKYLGVPKTSLVLVKGEKSKIKTFEFEQLG